MRLGKKEMPPRAREGSCGAAYRGGSGGGEAAEIVFSVSRDVILGCVSRGMTQRAPLQWRRDWEQIHLVEHVKIPRRKVEPPNLFRSGIRITGCSVCDI